MKVLVVDDEPLVRRSLEKVFSKREHEVVVAVDGSDAVEKWKDFSPEVVVIDVLMPGLTGPEVIAEMAGHTAKAVVLISAFSGDYDPDSVKQLGADLFIEKPFSDIQKLAADVEALANGAVS